MVSKHLFGKEPVSKYCRLYRLHTISLQSPSLPPLSSTSFFYSLKMKKPTGLTKNRPEAGFGPQAIFGSSWWKGRCLSYLNFYQDFFSAITLSREYLKHVAYISTEPQEINSLLSQGFFRFPGVAAMELHHSGHMLWGAHLTDRPSGSPLYPRLHSCWGHISLRLFSVSEWAWQRY